MGKNKVLVTFESDELSPMEILQVVKRRMSSLVIEISGYKAIDWVGHNSEVNKQ